MADITSTTTSIVHKPEYFTPGLLSCLIVTLVLIGILSIAISWVSSLGISYGAFEKKVEHGKKVQ
jgi:hypothetical protein